MSSVQERTPSKSEVKILCFLLHLEPDEYAHLYLIAKQTGVSSSTLHDNLTRLDNSSFIESVEAKNSKQQRIKLYRLTSEGRNFCEERIKRYETEKGPIPEDWTRFFLKGRSSPYKHDDLMPVGNS